MKRTDLTNMAFLERLFDVSDSILSYKARGNDETIDGYTDQLDEQFDELTVRAEGLFNCLESIVAKDFSHEDHNGIYNAMIDFISDMMLQWAFQKYGGTRNWN